MSQAATFHLDGELLCRSLVIGVMEPATAVAHFEVVVDFVPHLVWALGESAMEVYAYAISAIKNADEDEDVRIQINVAGMPLRTAEMTETLFAKHFSWHTSKRIREQAMRLQAQFTTHSVAWPSSEILPLPVVPMPGRMERRRS